MKFTFAPEAKPLPGYTIKRAIYRGGFGEVYFAVTDAGREVALKLLQNNADVELRGVQQCLNLSHPNLVTIFDIVKDNDGDHWIVMEYIAGQTLEAALRNAPQGLPIERVQHWLAGLADGIEFLHSRGLVHRDLKPANLFLDNHVVKIGDVGLSKFIAPSQRSAQTQSVGTVYYMAPEVAKGSYGREVDVYATGIILYEMLTGDVPFDGESTGEILMKHLTASPDLTKLPKALQSVINKALSKSPEQRYPNLKSLRADFEQAVAGEPASRESYVNGTKRKKHGQACGTGWQKCGGHQHSGIPHDWMRDHWNFWQPYWLAYGAQAKSKFDQHSPAVAHALERRILKASEFIDPIEQRLRDAVRHDLPRWGMKWTKLGLVGLGMMALFVGMMVSAVLHRPLLIMPGAMMGAFVLFGTAMLLPRTFGTARPASNLEVPAPIVTPVTLAKSERVKSDGSQKLARALGMASLIAPLTLLLSGLIVVFKKSLFQVSGSGEFDMHLFGWFVLVAIIAGWSISVLRWLQSRSPHLQVSRLTMAMFGALTGAAAWDLQKILEVDFVKSVGHFKAGPVRHLGDYSLYSSGEGITLLGFSVFFAVFFAARNWTKLTSPSRDHRFSIWPVVKTVFLAWILTLIFPFPSQWALPWAAVISCTVQLASPWNGISQGVAEKVPSRTLLA